MPLRPFLSLTAAGSLALCLALLLVAILPAQAPPGAPALDPDQPYLAEKSNPVVYQVDFQVVVTPPYKTKKLAVWLPVPPSDAVQTVSESKLSSFPLAVEPVVSTEPVFGNQFAYFEFAAPQGAQIIRHQFRIQTHELRWKIEPAKIQPVQAWPVDFAKYRRGEAQAVVVDERFRKLLAEIAPAEAPEYTRFGGILNWVQQNLTYDHQRASLQASAEHALTHRRGHCSDYHGICASLGRVLGVPTRVTYGVNPFPKNSPSHCKLEAFLHPYGWVSFDVSETQKLVAEINKSPQLNPQAKERLVAAAQARLASGFRDNTWYLQTRGTDYDLAPKASRKVAVVRTAFIEADGVPLPEPDPADPAQKGFSWMTVHEYRPDRLPRYPFADWTTLEPAANP